MGKYKTNSTYFTKNYFFGRALVGFCPQGRRASGYANASVLRFAPHWANAHPPHASRKKSLKPSFLRVLCKVLACKYLYFKLKQG
ncbi:MAG: hypothetical protein RML38_06955, partial [Bacteroidia bacterium]|nr:hypothetical protein [Bacteroidia bacterium]